MAKKRSSGLPEFHDVQPQLEAEVRRALTTSTTSAAPPGAQAMPHFDQATLDTVMRVLPVIWDSFRRVVEAAYGGS